eukprot:sb/3465382/
MDLTAQCKNSKLYSPKPFKTFPTYQPDLPAWRVDARRENIQNKQTQKEKKAKKKRKRSEKEAKKKRKRSETDWRTRTGIRQRFSMKQNSRRIVQRPPRSLYETPRYSPNQTFINYNVKLFIEAWPLGNDNDGGEALPAGRKWKRILTLGPRDYDIDYAKVQRYSESKIDDHDRMLRNAFKNCSSEEVINLSCRTIVSSIRVVNRYLNAQHVMNCKVKETELRMQKCKEELDKHRISVIDLQNKIIALQDRHLESASNSVAKMKAYSTVLSQNWSVITPKVVKNAAIPDPRSSASSDAVAESDRAKNLVVFGLPESTNRVDSISVKELFDELNEKPVTKSMKRLGLKLDSSSKPRPLVISLENRESLLLKLVMWLRGYSRLKKKLVKVYLQLGCKAPIL